jgi:hypothetical protein
VRTRQGPARDDEPRREQRAGPGRGPGRNADVDFLDAPRSIDTHQRTTDKESRLFKKGEFTGAKLRFMTHALRENWNRLVVDVETTQANRHAERAAAITMIDRTVRKEGAAIGADRSYDVEEVAGARRTQEDRQPAGRPDCVRQGLRDQPAHRGMPRLDEGVGGLCKARHVGLQKIAGQALLTFGTHTRI